MANSASRSDRLARFLPEGPESVALLLDAGADPNDDTGGGRPETPLHRAASSDDVEVAEVLIDSGARLDTPDGSIGTPLDNAVGYGCWHVARPLVQRGAPVEALWQAAALGMLDHRDGRLRADPVPSRDECQPRVLAGMPRRPEESRRTSARGGRGHQLES